MTKRKCTPANGLTTTITKTQRQLKVKKGYYNYQAKQLPKHQLVIGEILLKGKWLTDAGFSVNSSVTIQIQQGKLIITSE